MCKRVCEIVLAIVLVVIGLLDLSASIYKWTLVIGGAVLLLHAFFCKKCCGYSDTTMPAKAKRKR